MARFEDEPVVHGMYYAVQGGKGLRAYLVIEGARLHGIEPQMAKTAAAAIEAVHAYSLVHDDLPDMDNDDLRRGRPTVHREWNPATAILVGDALLTLAFSLLAEDTRIEPSVRVRLIASLAQAAGAGGMVLGQAQDIAAQTAPAPLTLDQITKLQERKTGALIQWSAQAGPLLAGADIAPMERYARALGLAFQIADDLLDVEGNQETTGKAVRKDKALGKATFVSLLGVDGARARALQLIEEACAALETYGEAGHSLRDAARFVIERDV